MGCGRQDSFLYAVIIILLLTSTLVFHGCGGGGSADILVESDIAAAAEVYPAAEVLPAEIPQPDGVSAEVWDELTEAIRGMSFSRNAAFAPATAANTVSDLVISDEAGTTTFTWTYRNVGDYDVNGVVNVSDMTPVGIYYGLNSLDPEWDEARAADGTADGEIGIGDITPIGQMYLSQVDGYLLQTAPDFPGPWEDVTSIAWDTGVIPADGILPVFTVEIADAVPQSWYRVTPYYDDPGSGDRQTGVVGSPVQLEGDMRGDWWMEGGNNKHSCYSNLTGPTTNHVLWKKETGSYNSLPVIDFNNNVLIGSGDGLLFIELDGTSYWCFHTGLVVDTTPAIAVDGTIYFGCSNGIFYALNPDRTLHWAFDTGVAVSGSPAIAPDGSIWFATFEDKLYGLTPDGSVLFNYPVAEEVRRSPAIAEDGTVFFTTVFGVMIIRRPDGSIEEDTTSALWTTLADVPHQLGEDEDRTMIESYFEGTSDSIEVIPVTKGHSITDQYRIDCSAYGSRHFSMPAVSPDGYLFSVARFGSLAKFKLDGGTANRADFIWEEGSANGAISFPFVVTCSDGTSYYMNGSSNMLRAVNADGAKQVEFPIYTNYPPVLAPNNIMLVKNGYFLYAFGGSLNGLPPGDMDRLIVPNQYYPGRVELKWEGVNGAEIYEIYRNGDSVPCDTRDAIFGDVGWSDLNVDPATDYEYRVRAVNSVGSGGFSEPVTVTTKLSQPQGFVASQGEYPDRVELSWVKSENATGYLICRDSGDFEAPLVTLGDVDSWVDSSLTDWSQHSYRIMAFNSLTRSSETYALGWLAPGAGDSGPGDWPMPGRDAGRSRRSTAIGPLAVNLQWEYSSPLSHNRYDLLMNEPLIGAEGSIFLPSANSNSRITQCVRPDGSLLWELTQIGGNDFVVLESGTLAVGRYSTCAFLGTNGANLEETYTAAPAGLRPMPDGSLLSTQEYRLVSFNRDESLNWYYDVSPRTPVGMTTVVTPGGLIISAVNTEATGPSLARATAVPFSFPLQLHCLNPDGSVRWISGMIDGFIGMVADADDRMYLSTADMLYCLDMVDGSELWRFEVTGCMAMHLDGVCLLDNHHLTQINVDGSLEFTRALTEQYVGENHPAVDAEGHIYFCEFNYNERLSNVVALNPDGSELWNHSVESYGSTASPSIGNDGTLYCAFEGYPPFLLAFSAD